MTATEVDGVVEQLEPRLAAKYAATTDEMRRLRAGASKASVG